jgi:hypothetical protein
LSRRADGSDEFGNGSRHVGECGLVAFIQVQELRLQRFVQARIARVQGTTFAIVIENVRRLHGMYVCSRVKGMDPMLTFR